MASPYDGDPRKPLRHWQGPDEPPRVCVWEITLKCDLACRHCGSRAGPQRERELNRGEAFDIVRQLAGLGIREVILIGGEAYLREDWAEIAAAITQAGMSCSMVTGGYGFDAFHLEEAIAAGVRLIGISIDGIAATHDHLRGRIGSFEAAIETAQRIRQSGRIELSINSQINRLSLPELPKLARLVAELGATAWQLQLTVALGRAADRPDLLLQPYHMLTVVPLLALLKERILTPADVRLFPGNNIGYFGPLEKAIRYGGDRGALWSGCLAGRAALGLEADGILKGCPSLPTDAYSVGSVRDTPIETLWRESDKIKALGRRTRKDLWGFCNTCEHADRCLGGCTWTAHALFGRPGNNPYCHHRATMLAREGKRERIAIVERAPGRPFDHGRFELVEEPFGAPTQTDELEFGALLGELLALDPEGGERGVWSEKGLKAATAKTAAPKQAEAS